MPFDQSKADRAIRFIRALKHTKGHWRGVPFEPLDWQTPIIRDVFGTVNEDGFRQYNTAYVEVPKKQGKSEIAAAISLYLTCADGEFAAEVYGAAADRQQASIVFDVAVDMVDQCPALKKRIRPVLSQKRLVYLPTKSFYQVLSAESFTKHGYNVHGLIFDELHAQPDRKLWDTLTKGSGDARRQPLFFVITTAGDDPDRTSICWEIHQKARAILDGTREDPTFYPVIYGLDEEDDWHDEENWKRANPSLGVTVQIDRMRSWYKDALENHADEMSFRRLRLNQWLRIKLAGWMSLTKWDATAGMVRPEKLKGRPCFGGLDLSSKLDITSFVLLFPPHETDKKWRVLPWFWIPEENIKEREETDKIPYRAWVKKKLIHATPGSRIDYKFIEKTIKDAAALYDIQEIGFDPWNAQQTATNLAEEGLPMVEVRQGPKTMSPAMKELEAIVIAKQLAHGGNPVLRVHVGNVQTKQDENENIRPVKQKSTGRIDGAVAMINAMARAMLHVDESSIYEERGIL